MKKNSLLTTIIIGVILYALSTSLSYGFFQFTSSRQTDNSITSPVDEQQVDKKSRFKIDTSLPLKEECPLNGMFYTKKEKDIWEKRRPLAIMLSNASEGRPVAGLSLADIVYEAVAEGGITRYMPIFYCGASLGNIEAAPIRSARVYFIDWMSEYDALYNHVGGANRIGDNVNKTDAKVDAIGLIRQYGIKDLDQFGIGYPDCYRNPERLGHEVATEHTMVCKTDNLFTIGAKRGWTNVDEDGISWNKNFIPFKFKDEAKEAERGQTTSITFGFWDGYNDYDVKWDFDKPNNIYLRSNGGKEQFDTETDERIKAKNVIVQFAKETGPIDENHHMYYDSIGEGTAIIFQDGKAIKASWKKKNRLARTLFYDENAKEIKFNRGQIWIEIVPLGNKVIY